MATPKGLIDEIIPVHDGVVASDGHNATRRVRLLYWLNRIHAYTWTFLPWRFTFKEAEVTITAVNAYFTALPADYLEFSAEGYLFDRDRNVELRERDASIIRRIRRTHPGGLPSDKFGVDGEQIIIPYNVGSNTVFTAYYRYKAPALIDDTTEMAFPDRWADVLRAGLVYKGQQSKNDARPDFGAEYQQKLSLMAATENPMKTSTRRLPLAVRGAW